MHRSNVAQVIDDDEIDELEITVPAALRYVRVLRLAAAGTLRPVIDSTYPLSDAGAAMARVDAGGLVGKVLVVPDAAGD